ncbi:MAG: flagellar hook-basal body complex protein FliE [Bacillota bacterium]|nr:flagellar hook-basal body complex protein FliE [Bacillota bacterium]
MINPLSASAVTTQLAPGVPLKAQATDKVDFSKQLTDALNNINEMQVKADDMATKLVLGEIDDLHQVTVAMEQAKLSLQLAVQVRNKIVEAYQEIARMQV